MKSNKYSNLKITQFPAKIDSFKAGIITAPIYVRLKPTNHCNMACSWCSYSDGTKRPKDQGATNHLQGHMHEEMVEQDNWTCAKGYEIIDDLAAIGVRAVTFSGGGEPLLHPNIVDFLKLASSRNLDISIITNGQLLVGERADLLRTAKWVRVSIDYTTAEQMVASRRVSANRFDTVLANLATFAVAKNGCELGINFIVTRDNCDGLYDFASRLKDIGVQNIRFSPVYVENFRRYHEPIRESVDRQLQEIQTLCDDRFSVNSTYDIDSPSKSTVRPFSRCLYAQTVPVIGADLGVYGCHNVAYTKHGLIGHIRDRRFSDLWFSDEARQRLTDLNPSLVCRHECANHAKVALFNDLAESHSDNFV
jgi:MoaA/NifB/PqqE/SkfB family radical SAM enzyme